jgi:hypothetical protein
MKPRSQFPLLARGEHMSLKDLEAKIKADPQLLVSFIADPKSVIKSSGSKIDDPSEVRRLEIFARAAQEQLRAAGKLANFDFRLRADSWGIGAGCCNGSSLFDVGARINPNP